jgi:hypothetical protein
MLLFPAREGRVKQYIEQADDEQNFTRSKFTCHKKTMANTLKIYNILFCKRNY